MAAGWQKGRAWCVFAQLLPRTALPLRAQKILRNPGWTLRRVPDSDTSDAALVGKAVANHKAHKRKPALANGDSLIAKRLENPYMHELKGWILMETSRSRDSLTPGLMRNLGLAYSRNGQNGPVLLSDAERHSRSGRLKDASIHAKRAVGLLPRGSTGWRRADDILHAAETKEKRNKRK